MWNGDRSTPGERRRARRLWWTALALVLPLVALAIACGGGNAGSGTEDEAAGDENLTPVIISSDLAVGSNRFALGLIAPGNELVTDASVDLRFFKRTGEQAEFRAEMAAETVVVEKSFTHVHEDGVIEGHDAGEVAAYVASVEFDEAGDWGVQISGERGDKPFAPVTAGFSVLQTSKTVAVGAPAPRSIQPTLAEVEDIQELDTSEPPMPGMHDMTIADAVTSGEPTIIVFATPEFCESRICGPTKQTVDDLFETHRDDVAFVHVEPFDLEKLRSGEGFSPVPAALEWGLATEPWVFLVDRNGHVSAKYEGIVTAEELEAALSAIS
jgi:hypothetical protein